MNYVLNIPSAFTTVKSGGWSSMPEGVIGFVRSVMETILRAEQEEHLGCRLYRRSRQRRCYANGSYRRTLSTSYGVIHQMAILRLRQGRFVSQLLHSYRRRSRNSTSRSWPGTCRGKIAVMSFAASKRGHTIFSLRSRSAVSSRQLILNCLLGANDPFRIPLSPSGSMASRSKSEQSTTCTPTRP